MDRREFLQVLAVAGACHMPLARAQSGAAESLYEVPPSGDIRILYTSDMHSQALPIYFREPGTNLGADAARGQLPHLVGDALLQKYGIARGSALAYALSYLDFDELAARYGKVGGMAHVTALCRRLRGEYGADKTLHLDAGDMLQGSAVSLRNRGKDMVDIANRMGIDAFTGHWEFTYPEAALREALAGYNGEFIAHNIYATEEAQFDGVEVYDEDSGGIFPPYIMREAGGKRIAVIGQAFPFTPIANPQRFIPDWTFGIRGEELQALVAQVRQQEKPDLVILLSHNGTSLDLHMAKEISGIDIILGGHTHDALVEPLRVSNAGGVTAVCNAGCCGKFVGCLDIDLSGRMPQISYRLLPVFSRMLPAAADVEEAVARYRAPYEKEFAEVLCMAGSTLYRRGTFNGGMDQAIVNGLREHYDAQVALSPGFRWGTTVPAGAAVRMEDVLNATAMTYPETYVQEMAGGDIHAILEDIVDNMFHPDAVYRQGGDMVRTGGLRYTLVPSAGMGSRIRDLRLGSGEAIARDKQYKVTGWATTGAISPGPPVWEITANYLRAQKTFSPGAVDTPKVVGRAGDPGLGDHPADLL